MHPEPGWNSTHRPPYGMPGQPPDTPELLLSINTTPLIDILLVLLVMLIVTIPVQLHALRHPLPVGVAAAPSSADATVRIDIDAAGSLRWQGTPLEAAGLAERLRTIAGTPKPPALHLHVHPDAPYAAFAAVLASTRRHGALRVLVAGTERSAP